MPPLTIDYSRNMIVIVASRRPRWRWLQQDERCHQTLVIQPLGRSVHKTDPRDAKALSERLWVNRDRLLRGDRVQGVRTVLLPSEEQQADRHLTQLRQRLVLKRTQTLNQI